MDKPCNVEWPTLGRCAIPMFSVDNGSLSADFAAIAASNVGVEKNLDRKSAKGNILVMKLIV